MLDLSKMTFQDFQKIEGILITDFDDFWSSDILKNEIIGENKEYIVAKKDGIIVGFAGIMIIDKEIEIMNIVTRKNKRGQGIATALLKNIIKKAEKLKAEKIFLEVNEKNFIAIKLYENAGFENIGIRKKYYNSTDDAIIMSKKINNL